MDNEKQDGSEVLETTEADTEAVETTEEEVLTAEQIAELREKAAKVDDLEAKNKQLYERAKKAKAPAPTQVENTLTPKDTIALINAKVETDDFDEVTGYAKYKGMTIADALKDKTLQSILSDRVEERKTANATQTKSARGASKPSGDSLIDKAKSGDEVPLSQVDDLAAARMARLKSRLK